MAVKYNIRRIIEEYCIEKYSEYPAGSGRIDIYIPRQRLIFETKVPKTISLKDKLQLV